MVLHRPVELARLIRQRTEAVAIRTMPPDRSSEPATSDLFLTREQAHRRVIGSQVCKGLIWPKRYTTCRPACRQRGNRFQTRLADGALCRLFLSIVAFYSNGERQISVSLAEDSNKHIGRLSGRYWRSGPPVLIFNTGMTKPTKRGSALQQTQVNPTPFGGLENSRPRES